MVTAHHPIIQTRNTLVLHCLLRGAVGPFTYNPGQPGDLTVRFLAQGSITAPAARAVTVHDPVLGIYTITIATENLPADSHFEALVVSPTGAFYGHQFPVELVQENISGQLDDLNSMLALSLGSVDSTLATLVNQMTAVLAVVEFNTERTFIWNEAGTRIEAVDIAFVQNDSTPNYLSPDKRFRISYTRDGAGRVTRAVCQEVAV